MANELMATTKNFANTRLNELTQEANAALVAFGAAKELVALSLAKTFHKVDAEEVYKDGGFKNTAEYIVQTFGGSQASAYAYIQVGRAIALKMLPEVDANGNKFSYTQLRAMVAHKNTKELGDWVDSGEIDSETPCKAIEEKVKAGKKPRAAVTKRFRFCYMVDDIDESGKPTGEVVELGTHSLEEFRAKFTEVHGAMLYAEFSQDGQHHFLYLAGNTPVYLVKAYELPKTEKPTKATAK